MRGPIAPLEVVLQRPVEALVDRLVVEQRRPVVALPDRLVVERQRPIVEPVARVKQQLLDEEPVVRLEVEAQVSVTAVLPSDEVAHALGSGRLLA